MSLRASIPDTMRAVRLHGPGDVRVERLAVPAAPEGAVLLHMRSVGICGSDLHLYREGTTGGGDPEAAFVPGHEIAAEVTETSAEQLGLAPGTLVAVDPAHPCGDCAWCRRGDANLCPDVRFMGVAPHQGGLAEYMWVQPEEVVPVPDSFDADTTALLEPLGVAIHALDLARLRPVESVAVLGAGPIGLLALQVARRSGAGALYAVDPLAYRADLAAALGADAAGTSLEQIDEWTQDRGVDVVLEATNAPEGFADAVEAARIGGRIVLVGIPEGDAYHLPAATARRKGLTVHFSRRMGEVYPRAIELVRRGWVDVEPLVTHRWSLDRTPEALEMQASYADGVVKSVIYI